MRFQKCQKLLKIIEKLCLKYVKIQKTWSFWTTYVQKTVKYLSMFQKSIFFPKMCIFETKSQKRSKWIEIALFWHNLTFKNAFWAWKHQKMSNFKLQNLEIVFFLTFHTSNFFLLNSISFKNCVTLRILAN